MTLYVAPGQVAVPSQNNTGSTLCTSDAAEQVAVGAAPPAGQNRTDLIVCRPRDVDLDGVSPDGDFIFDVVAGAAGGAVPATPAGTTALYQVRVPGAAAALTPADLTDVRPGNLAVPLPYVPPPTQPLLVWRGRGPNITVDINGPTNAMLIQYTGTLPAGTYEIKGRGAGNASAAVPTWMNMSLGATAGPAFTAGIPYLFSLNAGQIVLNAVEAGDSFTVVTLPATAAVGWQLQAATAGNAGAMRVTQNTCELLVTRLA
jgi:hypothetical protein